MTSDLNTTFGHRSICICGEAATTTLNPEPGTMNPEPGTMNLELSIVFLFPAVYNTYMIIIL